MRCGVEWPVCPDCPGARVGESAGRARCERCGSSWPVEARTPCPDPATVGLVDSDGVTTGLVCASHAAHPSAALLRKVRPPGQGVGSGR